MDSDIKLQAEIYHFDLPLRSPLWINQEKISRRQGFILILSTPDGKKGLGEISPLPGLHVETGYDAGKQLQNLCSQIPTLNQVLDEVKDGAILTDKELYPSVRFGLESAIIDLLADREGLAPSQILDSSEPCKNIQVNGLIMRDENITKQIEFFLNSGYSTVKIKLGNQPIAAEIQKIHDVYRLIENSHKIRIDANRSWSVLQAEELYNNIESAYLDYIEEPLQDAEKLPELFESTGMPIAIDESIKFFEKANESYNWCRAIILKPALLGSVFKTYQLIKQAADQGIITVISDTFQSGIGMTMLANLSALARGDQVAMGLDTIRWMDDDILKNRIQIENGKIELSSTNKTRHDIVLSKLDKIV
jgi:o-succinylbenzoate synthase